MEDKITKVKKDIKCIINTGGLVRVEKSCLVKARFNALSKTERQILLKEYRRDYETYNRTQDIKEIVSVGLTSIGMLIALFGILFQDRVIEVWRHDRIVCNTILFVVFSILSVTGIQIFRSSNMNKIKHILDILEE